ncbi:DUF4145 domain-containing protein [Verminephrobacter aporrectodeae subsp. tuberculatae]|uniref:DUF4145 domain-containing protein n=1 Tax=Verminephrobacter aporrectodeae subsp. tuberculatae TaxID=1110392 RepID=A0ABT3KYZ7_9BURK|nr:DUF4145 domain-containing protein [Verminephrobacter aporrectodeae]MCW5323544.1 DUF4145 domain-containing protein [Verminephrobacter aporrectodeae subsp. tuberculatae]
MDRELFSEEHFFKEAVPKYRCPRCGLFLTMDNLVVKETAETKADRLADPAPDRVEQTFRADFTCEKEQCGEVVFCVGKGFGGELQWDDPSGSHSQWVETLVPTFFQPHLMMFMVPEDTPEKVRGCVHASFRVFFSSPGNALNELRNALESLMDHLQVARKIRDTRKPLSSETQPLRKLSLHERIERLPKEHAGYKSLLLAQKWIGNAGTHGDPIKRDDVLDGYKLLEHVLDGIFSLHPMATNINENKAPQSISREREATRSFLRESETYTK